MCIGWVSIYAALYNDSHSSIFDTSQRYGMQLIWILAAIGLAMVVMLIDSKAYSAFAYFIYGALLILLLLVLFIGIEVNGSKSWIAIGSVRLQPAEMAKVATSLALAKLMSEYGFKLKTFKSIAKIGIIILLPVLFIFLQHDTGSALVFGSFCIMFFREGLSGWLMSLLVFFIAIFLLSLTFDPYVVYLLVAAVAFCVYAVLSKNLFTTLLLGAAFFLLYAGVTWSIDWIGLDITKEVVVLSISGVLILYALTYAIRNKLRYLYLTLLFFIGSCSFAYSVDYVVDNILEAHQRIRIENLVGKNVDLKKAGYNVHQSKIAIGSGGFSGKGFLQGTQTRYNYVPEQSTDFIFCTVGEEWGFLGSFIVVILYTALLIKLMLISERQKFAFARIYGYCVVSILFFHFFINISMTIGLAPVIGIPLPFISYGGSSLWTFTAMLFILLKFDADRLA